MKLSSNMRPAGVALFLFVALGCTGLMPLSGASGESSSPEATGYADLTPEEMSDLEDEEEIHEDTDALAGLIHSLEKGDEDPPLHGVEPGLSESKAPSSAVPVAQVNWKQSKEECMDALDAAGVEVSEPDFETPFVGYPVLLEGPVGGVKIAPRWPRKDKENEVMDCRLVLALVELARVARAKGATEVLFYSTYRPLKAPTKKCKDGKAGKKCRKKKKAYENAKKTGKMSQHRRATAIDIRWFTMEDGRTVDVLEHYERHSGDPPCADEPETEDGIFLKELACELHEKRIFNVMLTPNSNKDHHNHFHFDITPGASWYIIR